MENENDNIEQNDFTDEYDREFISLIQGISFLFYFPYFI